MQRKSQRSYLTPTIHEAFTDAGSIELPREVDQEQHRCETMLATLSVPVRGRERRALRDNSQTIVQIILRRQPGLLLCAGWSVPTRNLGCVINATRHANTVAVLETADRKKAYWRIEHGQPFEMGKQLFSTRSDTNDNSHCLVQLTDDLPKRSFRFSNRNVLLLICGEVCVVQGRNNVDFHRSAPRELRDALGAKNLLILNPTHTRMGNDGTIKAWRKFLSQEQRIYVSASNWDLGSQRVQQPSKTLHSLWHDTKSKKPSYRLQGDFFDYREWELPSVTKTKAG